MTYKTMLVHVADSRRAERLMKTVVPIASAMGCHVIGLAVMPPMVVVPAADGMGLSTTIDEHRLAYGKEIARAKEIFTRATAPHPIPSEWREADAGFSSVALAVTEHARASDVTVLMQRDDGWPYAAYCEEPDRVALNSGRPVLLIPNAGDVRLPPSRATIAWNGSREAARAVFDALPLLASTDAVEILTLDPPRGGAGGGDLAGADLAVTLSRHGLKPEVSSGQTGTDGAGAEIARRAAAFGSDLIVMGCYGHSRLREFILGGATRHMLAEARVPLLMAH